MGEKQIRAEAARIGTEVLGPLFTALGDLAVAANNAGEEPDLRTAARIEADRILADAEAEILRRKRAWSDAYKAARTAGWSVEALREAGQRQPPEASRQRTRKPTKGTLPAPPADNAAALAPRVPLHAST